MFVLALFFSGKTKCHKAEKAADGQINWHGHSPTVVQLEPVPLGNTQNVLIFSSSPLLYYGIDAKLELPLQLNWEIEDQINAVPEGAGRELWLHQSRKEGCVLIALMMLFDT